MHTENLKEWVRQLALLREQKVQTVLVSSGAVAVGLARLGWSRRPRAVPCLQAAAAVGQSGLVQAYEEAFRRLGLCTAQILLTHEDIADRRRYLNARGTLRQLLSLAVIPVVNENDTISTEEIQFGDNDTLAGLTANLIEAERMVLLTDRAGLHERDPALDADAPLVRQGRAGDAALEQMAGTGGAAGRGGMKTKLQAAAVAAKSGTDTIIANGLERDILLRLAAEEALGTHLQAGCAPVTARKQWLAGQSIVSGQLELDAGAVRYLREHGKSLLAVGIIALKGNFRRGEIVSLLDPEHNEIGRGMVNYDAAESRRIIGQPSERIEELLGYVKEPELIHRDNMILF